MNKRKMNQRLRSRANLDKGMLDKGWHSSAFHKHFEGYTEYEETNEKGKTVIKRVYIGEYYRMDMPKNKRIRLKLVYAAMWLMMAAVFGFCASRAIGANSAWYVAIGQLGVLVGLGWLFMGLLSYYTVPLDMTIGDWKSASKGMRKGCICAALAMELTALLTLVHVFLNGEQWLAHLGCVAGYVVAGSMAVVMHRLEANVPYLTFPSTEPAPEDGVYIEE